ncbi:MAG: DUF1016 domain-containing protein, partial [Bacteroidales bacterium]|nr:DUF1016 domain-containing protein [Bacteroidales bacterium]
MKTTIRCSIDYEELLLQAVAVLDRARTNMARTLTSHVNNTYWELGKMLYERKIDSIHGANVVNRLSSDLKQRYPSMGFSPRQLWNMKKFYLRFYKSDSKLLQLVAVLPWGHILKLITDSSTKNNDEAILYYVNEAVQKGWSRELLTNAIKLKMYDSKRHYVQD